VATDGEAPAAGDGPGALGTLKGVACGEGVACGSGVAFGDGVWTAGFFSVVFGVCACRDVETQDHPASAETSPAHIFALALLCITFDSRKATLCGPLWDLRVSVVKIS